MVGVSGEEDMCGCVSGEEDMCDLCVFYVWLV